ncbi:MAG: MMPL family transporter, partial [Nitrospiria bacterium]
RIDEKALNQHFGGTSTFYILVEGDHPAALKDPEVLDAIDGLQRQLEAVPGVGKTESYVDYVKKMNQTFHGGDPQYDRVPEDRQQVADFLFLYAISGNPGDFARLVDYDYKQAVIWSYLKSDSTALAEELIRLVEDYAREHSSLFEIAQGSKVKAVSGEQLAVSSEQPATAHSSLITEHSPPRLTLGVAGSAPVTVALNRTMVDGKMKNILQIAAIIFVASAMVLRSWIGGLLVLLPLALAVLINFGVMGLTGVTLGIGTAAISAMAVGIGADYAIYLLFRIREEYKEARSSKLKAQREQKGPGTEAQSSRLKAQSSGIEAQRDQQTQVDFQPSALPVPARPCLSGRQAAGGRQAGLSFELETAVHKALMTSGKAIVFVALSISAGYAILPFSGYYLHMEGILVPLAMITSCIGALVLLPTMVYTLKPRFIVSGK